MSDTDDRQPTRLKRLWRRVRFGLYVLVVTVVLIEVVVRISGYSDRYLYDPIYEPFPASDEIAFVHKASLTDARGRGCVTFNTDAMGLRCLQSGRVLGPKTAREVRIAVMGDSITFGEGVPDTRQTFCEILSQTLNHPHAAPPFTVLNFGVSAYSVREMAATLEYRTAATDPDVALMVIAAADLNLGRTGELDKWGYTYNPNTSSYLSKNSRIKRMLRSIHSTYFLRDLVYRLRGGSSPASDPEGPLPESYAYLLRFHRIATERRIAHAVVLLPTNEQWGTLREQLDTDAVPVIDLRDLYTRFTPEQYHASRWDGHPSPAVHELVGKALAKSIPDLLEPPASQPVDRPE